MIALYIRVSSIDQKTDRQRINEKDYGMVIEDKCSGSVPFFEREGGKQILRLINKGVLKSLAVWSIDRLGRNLLDILHTINFFNQRGISITFLSQSLRTLDENGKENPISKMMISILGVVGEMERNQIRERQREGIAIAKARGIYKGRAEGSKEDALKFLNKEKNRKALDLLKKGISSQDVSKITGLNKNTVTKIKRLGLVKA